MPPGTRRPCGPCSATFVSPTTRSGATNDRDPAAADLADGATLVPGGPHRRPLRSERRRRGCRRHRMDRRVVQRALARRRPVHAELGDRDRVVPEDPRPRRQDLPPVPRRPRHDGRPPRKLPASGRGTDAGRFTAGDLSVPSTNRGPLALGYIRRHPLMTDPEQEGMRAALSSFADAGGLRLAEVYIDTPATPSRYGAMVTAAQRMHAIVILVADPDHLGLLGGRA